MVEIPMDFADWPPLVGPTGSPIVSSEAEMRRDIHRSHYLPPWKPTRTVDVYDDDGEIIGEREFTDEEFAAAMSAYKQARAEWNRTGGVLVETGPIESRIEVVCADGCKATAIGDGSGGGVWVEYRTK